MFSAERTVGLLGMPHRGFHIIAREGAGPGELSGPVTLVTAGDALIVHDWTRQSASMFALNGRWIRNIPTPSLVQRLIGGSAKDGGSLYWLRLPLGLQGSEGEVARTQLSGSPSLVMVAKVGVQGRFPPGADSPDWQLADIVVDTAGTVYMLSAFTGEILAFSAEIDGGGRTVRTAGKPVTRSTAERREFTNEALRRLPAGIRGDARARAIILQLAEEPKPQLVVGATTIFQDSLIAIASTRDAGDSTIIELVTTTGRRCSEIRVRDQVRQMSGRGHLLAVVVTRGAARTALPGLDVYSLPPVQSGVCK